MFLLKKHDTLTEEQRREIFLPDRRITEKERKRAIALKRDQKVEELKKTLSKDNDLPVLGSRKDHMAHLMPEMVSTCKQIFFVEDFGYLFNCANFQCLIRHRRL